MRYVLGLGWGLCWGWVEVCARVRLRSVGVRLKYMLGFG